jgi:hypothetical protein
MALFTDYRLGWWTMMVVRTSTGTEVIGLSLTGKDGFLDAMFRFEEGFGTMKATKREHGSGFGGFEFGVCVKWLHSDLLLHRT